MNQWFLSVTFLVSFFALLLAGIFCFFVLRRSVDSVIESFALKIEKGAFLFLKKEYIIVSIVMIFLVLLLSLSLDDASTPHLWEGVWFSVSFIFGILASGLTGFVSMFVSTKANVRALQEIKDHGLHAGFVFAFRSAAVMGLSVAGIGLLGIAFSFFFFHTLFEIDNIPFVLNLLVGFGFGASSLALFARIGGGIYTKASDIASDLVGKIEYKIPEDDIRNPASIANNVGDNVGDIAGMGADLFESYVGSIISALILGYMQFKMDAIFFVFLLSSAGILASIIGIFFVKIGRFGSIHTALKNGLWVASLFVLLSAYFLCEYFFSGNPAITAFADSSLSVFIALSSGIFVAILMDVVTEYYTSDRFAPVQRLADDSRTGAVMNIFSGLALGYRSTVLPIVLISVAILFSYIFAGLFGIAIAALGMLSTLGISFAIGAYGPIVDNAKGIAEMAQLDVSVRSKTDVLDMVGNTAAAMGKGFAIGSTALTALALFAAYSLAANLTSLDILDPRVMIGLFLGAMIPYWFSALTLSAVKTSVLLVMADIRRQFTEKKEILSGKEACDFDACMRISTDSSLKEMLFPTISACVIPLFVGFVLGSTVLGGLLVGTLISSVLMAFFMTHAGGAWDNAKKYITNTLPEEEGSKIYKAAILGDAIGDPLKDTSGPALNILVKVMMIIALIFASLFSPDGLWGMIL